MAYGLKYELLCTSLKSRDLFSLKLLFDSYTGAEVDRDMPGERPLVFRKDKAAVVRGTSVEFAIKETVDFELDEFYTNNPKKIKAELYKGVTLLWAGYNLPQQYQADYVPAPVAISFTATDGLGLLKNEPFTLTGSNTQLATIIHCIDKIALGLGYSIAINLFETTHDHGLSPLAQTYEDAANFDDYDCYSVLEKILGKYDAEITQVNARWHITCSADKKSTRMLYTSAGVYEGTEAAPAVLDLGYPGAAGIEVWPIDRLSRSLEPGAKKVTLSHGFGRKKSFLSNYEFWRYAGGQFTGWTQIGSFTLQQKIKDGKAYAFLVGYTHNISEQIYQQISVENVTGQDFVFEVDFSPSGRTGSGTGGLTTMLMGVRVAVQITSGGTTYYLTKTGWTTTPTIIEETVTASLISPVWNRLKIVTDELPVASGTMAIALYAFYTADDPRPQDTYRGVAFSEPLVYFLNDGELYPSGLKTVATFSNSTEPGDLGEISVHTADAPALANAALLYERITRLSDGSITTTWHRLGEGTEYSLIVQLARTLASNNRVAREKLTGKIKGADLKMNSIIKHAYNSNKEYEIAEASYDIFNETWDVTLLEILAWSSQTIAFETVDENDNTGSVDSGGAIIGVGTGNDTGTITDADTLDGYHADHFAPIDAPVFTGYVTAGSLKGPSSAGHILIYADYESNTSLKIYDDGRFVFDTGNIGIGTANPSSIIEANTVHAINVDEEIKIGSYYLSQLYGIGLNYRIDGYGSPHGYITSYGGGVRTENIKLNSTGVDINGIVKNPSFTTGWGGTNWQISAAGDAELQNLIVRGSARFRELIIDQLSIISGSQLLSSARGKVLSVDTANSRVTLEDPNGRGASSFAVNDFFWIKNVDIDKNLFTDCRGQISAITGVVLTLDFSVTGANGAITDVAAGDIIVQRGHPTTAARQNLIYKTVTDANAPYERYMTGISSLGAFDDLDNIAAQIGDLTSLASHDIVPATPGIGLYTNNAYLSGIMKSNIVSVEGISSNIKISGPDIWENAANERSDIHINRLGYNGGNTQFRGTHIYNGKGDPIASFWGQYGGYESYIELNGHVFISGALQFYGNDSLSYVFEKTPSNNIRNSHDDEVAIESDVYYKVKTITLTKGLKGSVRINFSMKWVDNGGNGTTAYGRLYRNDNVGALQSLGTEQSTTSPAYVLMTQDITQQWNPGDKLELWIHTNDDMNQDQVVINNLRILYDNDPIVAVPSTNS